MGVKGLNVFVKSICPAVFKSIPTRFEGIRGAKIVIDATLITQRFHFARKNGRKDDTHPHITGWFRLARELEREGISAVCVFDGKGRLVAKEKEIKRRQEVRRQDGVRWSFENARSQRLKELKEAIEHFRSLSPADKRRVFDALNEPSFTDSKTSTLLQQKLMSLMAFTTPTTPLTEDQADIIVEKTVKVTPDEVIALFKSLSVSYKGGLAKLLSLSKDTAEDQSKTPPDTDELEKVMTKRQLELAVQEGNLWKQVTEYLGSPTPTTEMAIELNLPALVQQSHDMAESFDRRRNAPKQQIYKESRELLQAMGIPSIQTTGGIEAEALASSMVLAGHADFVASEDSDVIVYEANLLRNITSHELPLVAVSGSDVRRSLGLTREQFLDFALLLGTDFTDRILQIGPARAYQLIQNRGTIEAIVRKIKNNPKHQPSVSWDAYLATVEVARLVFKTLPPIPPLTSFKPIPKDDALTTKILQKYNLSFTMMRENNWDYQAAYAEVLGQNYFGDSPSTVAEH